MGYGTSIERPLTVFGVPSLAESPVNPSSMVDDPFFLSLEAWNQFDDQQPRLYFNYLLYDNNFNLVDFGFDQVSEAARIPADTALLAGHAFEKLTLELVMEQAGFVYIYVSNENDQNVTAYFDDLGVEHTYGNIAVATDFYPFGLAIAGRELERIKWRYGYQGEFAEKDEETGWNSFELRMYDPVIGRWLAIDPYSQFFTPYNGMGNNPINGLDPDGGFFNPIVGSDGKFRGFDDKGPGGEAIVYDGAFIDGMSQAAILDGGGIFFTEFASLSGMTSMEYQTFKTIYLKTFEHYLETSALIETGNLIKDITFGLSFITGGGSGSMARGSAGLTARGVGGFKYTKTAAKHLTDVVKKGAHKGKLARPYMNSPLTIQEIMATGKGVPDAYAKGALNFKVSGTFRGSKGTWELVIDPNKNLIYHFNFVH